MEQANPAPREKGGKNVRISVTLRPRYLAQLDAIAHQNEMGRTAAAAVILEEALLAMKEGSVALPQVALPQVGGGI